MSHRIRKTKDNNIDVWINDIPFFTQTYNKEYKFGELKYFYSLLEQENTENYHDEDCKLYDIITMYNHLETLNKHPSVFLPIFIKMAELKGHQITYENDKKSINKKEPSILIQNIFDAENINEIEYNNLIQKQSKHDLLQNEKYQITKYIYEKTFDTKFKTIEDFKKLYGKLHIMKNAYDLLDNKNILNSKNSNQKIKENIKKITIINDILENMNIDVKELKKNNISIEKNIMIQQKDKINETLKKYKIIFNLEKKFNIESDRQLLEKLKNILLNYGIEIKADEKNKNKKKENYTYTISFIPEVIEKIKKYDIYIKNFNTSLFINDFFIQKEKYI